MVVTSARQYLKKQEAKDETYVTVKVIERDDDPVAKINAAHKDAHRQFCGAMASAILAGTLLLEEKAKIKHGQWLAWMDANLEFGANTAHNYMRLAQLPLAEQQRVVDLPLRQAIKKIAEPRKRLHLRQSRRRSLRLRQLLMHELDV